MFYQADVNVKSSKMDGARQRSNKVDFEREGNERKLRGSIHKARVNAVREQEARGSRPRGRFVDDMYGY